MTAPICFLDTETTGLHPDRLPWEVAAVRREPDGTETEWQAFLFADGAAADPFGLKVGRFYERHPLGRWLSGLDGQADDQVHAWQLDLVQPIDAAFRLARMTHGAHIVGAVPDFDTRTLDPLLRDAGLLPAHHYHLIDVETLAVGYLAARGSAVRPPWSSDELGQLLGVEPASADERHTAMGDVRWVMRMYDAIMSAGAA